ncbi:MAG: cytochrome-c peroxidase [Gemmatimonadota bacterium]
MLVRQVKTRNIASAFVVGLLLAACGGRDLGESPGAALDAELLQLMSRASETGDPSWFALPSPDEYDRIPQDPKNPLTRAKVELGRLLFHDTALERDPRLPPGAGRVSCASCHFAQAGFQAGIPQGVGEGAFGFGRRGEQRRIDDSYPPDSVDVQAFRTPTVLNIAFQIVLGWSGQWGAVGPNVGTKYSWMGGAAPNRLGFQGVESQAIAALDTHGLSVEDGFFDELPEYRRLFDEAFPEVPEYRRYTDRVAALAIAAYQRTVLTNQAPFQRWLRGDRSAMATPEKRGAVLFFGEAGCVTCHTGPALNSMQFAALGMNDLYDRPDVIAPSHAPDSLARRGRGGFTRRPDDDYAYKVPQLYNLADSPFYGHGASFTSVREVVEYKNRAAPQKPIPRERLAPEFRPLGLDDGAVTAIVTFLSRSLQDPNIVRYVPSSVLSGRCFPNDDPQSRLDLECPPLETTSR